MSEYSTDVLFGSPETLEELMPRLLTYSTLYFEACDVMAFLGRKLSGNFLGDVVTDQIDFSQMPKRLPGWRVKHRMKRNWMKMYNKEGAVLRVETVINDPEEFRIRRRVRRHGRSVMAWVPHPAHTMLGAVDGIRGAVGAGEVSGPDRVCGGLAQHYVHPRREAKLGGYRMVLGMLMLLFIGFQRLGHFTYVRTDAMVCGILRVAVLSAV